MRTLWNINITKSGHVVMCIFIDALTRMEFSHPQPSTPPSFSDIPWREQGTGDHRRPTLWGWMWHKGKALLLLDLIVITLRQHQPREWNMKDRKTPCRCSWAGEKQISGLVPPSLFPLLSFLSLKDLVHRNVNYCSSLNFEECRGDLGRVQK